MVGSNSENYEYELLQKRIGTRVWELRRARGITQCELSDKSNIARSYLVELEHGRRNISSNNIQRLIAALDVTVAEFFDAPAFRVRESVHITDELPPAEL